MDRELKHKDGAETVSKEELLQMLEEYKEEIKELKRQKRYGLIWEEQEEEVEMRAIGIEITKIPKKFMEIIESVNR